MCHEACDGDDAERRAGGVRSAEVGVYTVGESRGALRLVNLNADGAREISSVPRVAAASRSRRASRRPISTSPGGGGSGQAGFIELRSFRHAPLPGEDDEFGMGGFGSDETTANGSRWFGRSGSCADGRVVRARGAMEAEGRVDSAHSRVFPGKSTANGRFLGFSRGTLSQAPTGAMDYGHPPRAPAFLVPSHARRRRVVSRRCPPLSR